MQGDLVRPHSLGLLLEVIRIIMTYDLQEPVTHLTSPREYLNPGATVLVGCGNILPWCWLLWDDHRIAGFECILYLVRERSPPSWQKLIPTHRQSPGYTIGTMVLCLGQIRRNTCNVSSRNTQSLPCVCCWYQYTPLVYGKTEIRIANFDPLYGLSERAYGSRTFQQSLYGCAQQKLLGRLRSDGEWQWHSMLYGGLVQLPVESLLAFACSPGSRSTSR